MQSDFLQLEQFLNHIFLNHGLLEQAMTHPSFLHENGDINGRDYQRLEFLGDAILGMLLAEMLCRRYPEWDEGALSQLRSRLAGQDVLADRARTVGLREYILLGRGEEQSAGRDKDSILADVLEALIAALYLDAGIDAARSLIVRLFDELASSPQKLVLGRDFKSELQEFLSSCGRSVPEYHLIMESGPPHDRMFCFQILIDGQSVSEGQGKSKKIAQQAAAAEALQKLRAVGEQVA
ncbi:MAG: ribonuclease III [Desulfuromonadales bacterium]